MVAHVNQAPQVPRLRLMNSTQGIFTVLFGQTRGFILDGKLKYYDTSSFDVTWESYV